MKPGFQLKMYWKMNKWMVKQIGIYASISCISFFIFLCIFNSLYINRLDKNISSVGETKVQKSQVLLDSVQSDISSIISSVENEAVFSRENIAQLSREYYEGGNSNICERLKFAANNSMIADVVIYHRPTRTVFSKYGIFYDNGYFNYFLNTDSEKDIYKALGEATSTTYFPAEAVRFGTERAVNCIMGVSVSKELLDVKNVSLLFFINMDKLAELTDMQISDAKADLLIFSDKKRLLYCTESSLLTALDEENIQRITGNNEVQILNNKKYISISGFSKYSRMSEVFLVEYQQLYSEVNYVRSRTMYIFIWSTLICVLLLTIISGINLRPVEMLVSLINDSSGKKETGNDIASALERVKSMMKERESLKNDVSKLRGVMKNSVLYNLLMSPAYSENEYEMIHDFLEIDNNSCRFGVLIFASSTVGKIALRVGEMFHSEFNKLYFVEIHDDGKLIVITKIARNNSNSFDDYIKELKKTADIQFGSNVTIACGKLYDSITDISQSYVEAMTALDYAFIRGEGSIIHYDEIIRGLNVDDIYPYEEFERLSQHAAGRDLEKMQKTIDEIFDIIKNNHIPVNITRYIAYQIIQIISRITGEQNNSSGINIASIMEIKYISQLREIIDALLTEYMKQLALIESNENTEMLVEKIKTYIGENFADENFTISTLADSLGYSEGHLMRTYKLTTGKTILSCLTQQRMNQASTLLAETDMTIEKIAQMVGYTQNITFNRNFKRSMGCLPSEFRRKYKVHTEKNMEDM